MTDSPKRLAFIGTPELSVPFMKTLCASGYEIGLVVTGEDRRRGRGEEPSPSPVKGAAIEMELPVTHEIEDVKKEIFVAFGYSVLMQVFECMV